MGFLSPALSPLIPLQLYTREDIFVLNCIPVHSGVSLSERAHRVLAATCLRSKSGYWSRCRVWYLGYVELGMHWH